MIPLHRLPPVCPLLQIVREHYLRDDIFCGSELCAQCDHRADDCVLAERPVSKSTLFPFAHYLVLDTNVVLDQIHVLEEDVLCDVVLLQTVLDEVKHKSSLVYKKLKTILEDRQRNFYIFVNEHHKLGIPRIL